VLAVFSLVARYKYNSVLDTETAFTTVAILTMVTHPANMVMTTAPLVVASMASFERIEQYLLEDSRRPYREDIRSLPRLPTQSMIALRNVSIDFYPSTCPLLADISFTITRGSFVACLGPVGSGKTSLVRAIAGDLECSAGSIFVSPGPLGLCSQMPWLPAGTIRDVICGASNNTETEWYNTVVRACCLETDIRALPAQDQTQIGSRGLNLSGGQRQRVVSTW
jgi:ABC-type bacteriocin/lantibiotic exporter with double-glycine peptidase domain